MPSKKAEASSGGPVPAGTGPAPRAKSLSGAESAQDAALALGPELRAAAHLFAKRWTPLVLASLLAGPHRFNELRQALGQVSDRMLTERLKELERHGLVRREVLRGPPAGVCYRLTEAGTALRPVVAALRRWGLQLVELGVERGEGEL